MDADDGPVAEEPPVGLLGVPEGRGLEALAAGGGGFLADGGEPGPEVDVPGAPAVRPQPAARVAAAGPERDRGRRAIACGVMRTRIAVVGTLVASLAVVGGAWEVRHRPDRQQQCELIAGPDGWKFLDGACYDLNPWTGTYSRVDLP